VLGWICQHSLGFRLAVSIEGSRSYDVGPARPIAAAGLVVIHCEQPTRKQRRGKGKSDTIDAHLAVVTALQLDVNRLPTPRADGDREALRIAQRPPRAHDRHHRADQSTTRPLSGDDDAGRQTSRNALTEATLASQTSLTRRRGPRDADREHVRHPTTAGPHSQAGEVGHLVI
jgi:hypothetical protein